MAPDPAPDSRTRIPCLTSPREMTWAMSLGYMIWAPRGMERMKSSNLGRMTVYCHPPMARADFHGLARSRSAGALPLVSASSPT